LHGSIEKNLTNFQFYSQKIPEKSLKSSLRREPTIISKIQSQIVVIGTPIKPQKAYTWYSKKLDILFKFYILLDGKIQVTVEPVWLFLQQHLYEIKLKLIPHIECVNILLKMINKVKLTTGIKPREK
jgi:hypothetical protein